MQLPNRWRRRSAWAWPHWGCLPCFLLPAKLFSQQSDPRQSSSALSGSHGRGSRLQSLLVQLTLTKCNQDGQVSFCKLLRSSPKQGSSASVSEAVLRGARLFPAGCLAVCTLMKNGCWLWNQKTRWQLSLALSLPKEKISCSMKRNTDKIAYLKFLMSSSSARGQLCCCLRQPMPFQKSTMIMIEAELCVRKFE